MTVVGLPAAGGVGNRVIDGTTGAIVAGEAMIAIEPSGEVRTYVTDSWIEPVYLDGEVVVGARLLETVGLSVPVSLCLRERPPGAGGAVEASHGLYVPLVFQPAAVHAARGLKLKLYRWSLAQSLFGSL